MKAARLSVENRPRGHLGLKCFFEVKEDGVSRRDSNPFRHLRDNAPNRHFPRVNKCDNGTLVKTHETPESRTVSHFLCCNLLHGKPLVSAPGARGRIFCFCGASQPCNTILLHSLWMGQRRALAGRWRAFRVRVGLSLTAAGFRD